MSIFVVSIAIVSVTIVGLILQANKSPLNLYLVSFAMFAAVGIFFPLMSSQVEPITWRNLSGISNPTILEVQLNYLVVCVAYLLVGLIVNAISTMKNRVNYIRGYNNSVGRDRFISYGLVVVGLILYSVAVYTIGVSALIDRSNLAAKYASSGGLGFLTTGLSAVILGCLWAEGSRLRDSEKTLFRVVALAVVVWAIFGLYVRSTVLVVVLGYLYIWTNRSQFKVRQINLAMLLAAFSLWLLVEAFTFWRSDPEFIVEALSAGAESGQISANLGIIVGGSEFSHPFVTFAETVRDRWPGELAGKSYLREFLGLTPSKIWSDRPPTLAQEFVVSNYPDFALRGGGTGFSLVAEAWLNFGAYVGPFVLAVFFATCLAITEKVRLIRPDSMLARFAPALVLPVLMAERSSLIVSLKQPLFMFVLVFVLYIVYQSTRSASAHTAQSN